MSSEHKHFGTNRRRLSEVPEEDADAADEFATPLAIPDASRMGAPPHASQQPSEGSTNPEILGDNEEEGELRARLQMVEAEIPKIEAQLAEATASFEAAGRSASNPSLVARELLQVEMVLRVEKRKVADLQQSQREAYELRSSLRALLNTGSSDQLDLEDGTEEVKSGQSSGQLRVAPSSDKQDLESPGREDFPGFSPPAPVSLRRGRDEDDSPSAFSWSPRSAHGTASPTGSSSNRGRFSPKMDSPGGSPRISDQFTSSGAGGHNSQDEVESPMAAVSEPESPVTLSGTPYEDDPTLKELWQRMVEQVEKFQQQAMSSVEQARLLEHQVQLIQADLDASMAREVETQSQVYYKEGLTNAMQMEMNCLRDENAKLKHKLDKAEKDLAAAQIQNTKGQRQEPGSPVSVQENEERVRQDENAREERRMARMQTRVMELEEELRHAGSALECGAHEFKDKVMMLQQEKHQLEEESRNVRDANTQLQSQADQATAKATLLSEELEAVLAKVAEVEQSNEALEDETGDLTERVEELLETNSQLAHTVSRAQKENQLLAQGLKKEKMEVVARQEEVAEVRQAEERAARERDAWASAHQRLKEQGHEAEQDAAQLHDAMTAMEQKSIELQAAQEELVQAKQQIVELEQQIVLMSEELENLVTSKLREDAEEQNLVTKIREQEADLREAYQQLREEHSQLRQREQEARAAATEAETELAEAASQAEQATAEGSARIEELEHQIEAMAEEIERQTQKLVSTGKEMVEAERLAIQQHETCQVVAQQLQESESNRKRSQTMAEEMEIHIDHLTEELHKSSGQVVSAGVNIMEKEAEVEAAQKQVQIAGRRLENSERQRRRTMSVAFSHAAEQAEAKRGGSVSAAPPARGSESAGRASAGNPMQLQALIISNQVKDEQLKQLREQLAAKEAEAATEAVEQRAREEVEAAREEVGRARGEAEAAQQEVQALHGHLEQLHEHHRREMEAVREELRQLPLAADSRALRVHEQDHNSQLEVYRETGNGAMDDGEFRPYVDAEARCITKSIPLWEELGDVHNEHELQQLVEVRDERDMARALWDAHQDRQHAQNLMLDYQRIIDIYRTEMAHLADEGR
ncbi:hypothetical protein CYMTET_20960 [Cymbomonas tetramitiformis]|uniref:Uncharacterized protein n=1 Tax=Cymbomonas tetramitiformis TaxID=36881 RepID=A0AAE0L3G9_9CHLO|nr:hypothetical protein CYMTET_20960 [Cymbomonas tetramitiformis]